MRREDRSSISSQPLADLGGLEASNYVIALLIERLPGFSSSQSSDHERGRAGSALAVVADADRAPQRSGINQDRNHSLCHADQSQHEKLRVVEDAEDFDAGCPKSEK
jgi:hypothetical protein